MTNPFADYLSLYGPGVVAERPWWRYTFPDSDWVRCDGARSGELPDSAYTERTEDDGWRAPDETFLAHLDAYDLAHPLPAPRPMCGQVWYLATESTYTSITEVSPAGSGEAPDVWRVWTGGARLPRLHSPRDIAIPNGSPVFAWPFTNAVLVAGVGAPWAPTKW